MAPADNYVDHFTKNAEPGKRRLRDQGQKKSWTLALVDGGIAAALIVVPFFMGGRTPIGQLAFAVVAFWTAFWWAIHQALGGGERVWHNTLAFLALALGIGAVFLQIAPLTPSLIKTLSPHVYEMLPLWNPGDGQTTLGSWQTLSLVPETTRQSLTLLVSGVLLFVVTIQRIRRVSDVERIIRWLAISVAVMAGFGIVQFLTSNGKFFWFYEHPYSSTDECVKGAFTNRNHFAQFIALGFGAILWWCYADEKKGKVRTSQRAGFRNQNPDASVKSALKTLLVPLCVMAVLMSVSRGGLIALLVSCVAALFLLLNAGKVSKRTFALLAGTGLIVFLGLSIYGYDMLANRFEGKYSLTSLEGRSQLWAAACKGFGDHVFCGTGLSSHSSVYPMYLLPHPGIDPNSTYTHAENGYIQLALETGAFGLGLALTTMALCFYWCAAALSKPEDRRNALCFVGILPALLANAVHSCVDFVWYVPGCMGIVVILGACACRLYQLRPSQVSHSLSTWRLPRFAWGGMAVGLVLLGTVTVPILWQAFRADAPWNRYLALRRSFVELNRSTAYDEVQSTSESRKEILLAELTELSSVLAARPNWAEAHLCKAEVHRDLFHECQLTSENGFDLRMIRDTIRDNFDSVEAAREWLPRGIGEHYVHLDAALWHAHRALDLDPLHGEAYLLLAQLAFLERSPVPTKSAYVAQAFRVRPHDGTVLFEIGNELTLAGRADQALKYLKLSFAQGAEHQKRLIQMLAGNVPAEVFLQEFQPDADAMQIMVRHYHRPELESELEPVLVAQAAACEAKARGLTGAEAARYWLYAASSHGKLKNPSRQRECLRCAVRIDATNFDTRLGLGRVYLELEEFTEAEKQLRWCVQRKPGHPAAERLLERAVRGRIASANQHNTIEAAGRRLSGTRR